MSHVQNDMNHGQTVTNKSKSQVKWISADKGCVVKINIIVT